MNQLLNLDALKLIKSLPDQSVSLVLTDIPYGLNNKKSAQVTMPDGYKSIRAEWDHDILIDWMHAALPKLTPGGLFIVFCGQIATYLVGAEAVRHNWKVINDLTWEKPDAPPCMTGRMMTMTTERALVICPSGSHWTYNLDVAKSQNGGVNFRDVWRINTVHGRDRKGHPTQKPLVMFERLIQLYSCPGDVIVDPFCGSGTTALAALRTGRNYICGDLSAEYLAIAQERLNEAYTPLLEGIS